MKRIHFLILLILVPTLTYCQFAPFDLQEPDYVQVVKKNLDEVPDLQTLCPDFCRHLSFSMAERQVLDQMLNRQKFFPVFTQKPLRNNQKGYLQSDFDKLVAYSSVVFSTVIEGKKMVASGKTRSLNAEQKKLLQLAPYGSEIRVDIEYQYFMKELMQTQNGNPVKKSCFFVRLVPESPARFSKSEEDLKNYFRKAVSMKIASNQSLASRGQAKALLEINEMGSPGKVKLIQSSENKVIDKLILEAIQQMPSWIPGKNESGKTVIQEIVLSFGGGC